MTVQKNNTIWFLLALVVVLVISSDLTLSAPMLYKKNPQKVYEADLVPVSSTVIPILPGVGDKPSEEFTMVYLQKLRKRVQKTEKPTKSIEDPDTLITVKTKTLE